MKSSSSSTFFDGAEAPQETIQPIRLPNRFSFLRISRGSTNEAQKAQTPTSCIDRASVPKTRWSDSPLNGTKLTTLKCRTYRCVMRVRPPPQGPNHEARVYAA